MNSWKRSLFGRVTRAGIGICAGTGPGPEGLIPDLPYQTEGIVIGKRQSREKEKRSSLSSKRAR